MAKSKAQRMSAIRSGLRRIFHWYWMPAKDVKAAAKVGNRWQCAECKGLFLSKEVQVDHIVECGSLKDESDMIDFCTRLYALDKKAYRALCKDCHQIKTNAERLARKNKR